ncbi:MAG: segregation/condensation protein A [Thermodesulfovibrio sp.]|nr:segregation/condensation protein A [Thermodesulfovibrio sp.]
MEDLYNIKLPVFEGPMDLLLHLIRENKVDIYDIPIAFITHQYLEYLDMMRDLNLELAGDFLVMAATLIHIKSRMLLPVEEITEEEHMEDPRLELVQRLLEYQSYKDAASILREKEDDALKFYKRPPFEDEGEVEQEQEPYLFDVSIYDLLAAFRKMLEAAPPEVRMITRETLTVKDRMSTIVEMIEHADSIRFEEVFKDNVTRTQMIVTFLAMLELLRLGLVRVYQEKEFGSIWMINPQRQEEAPAAPEPSPA